MPETLGEAVVEVSADTKFLKRQVYKEAKGLDREGRLGGKQFTKGFNSETKVSSFGQLTFSFARVAAAGGLFLSSIVPLPAAMGGVVAGAVAITGAVGLAGGSLLSFSTAASSLGLAAITAKVAFGGMSDAVKLQTKALEELRREGKVSETTQKALDDSMKRLAPSARAVVKELAILAPAWLKFRQSIQQELFSGVAKEMKEVSGSLLPILKTQLGDTAGILNTATKGFGAFLSSAEGAGQVNSLLAGLNTSLRSLLPALGNVAQGLLTLFVGSTGEASQLSNSILGLSERFEKFATTVTESGEFQDFLRDAGDAAGALLSVLSNLGGIIGGFFGAGADEGVGMLETFRKSTQAIEDLIKSAEGQDALEGFFGLIGVAAGAFLDVMKLLKPTLKAVGGVFKDLKGPLNNVRDSLMPIIDTLLNDPNFGFADAIEDLGPILSTVADGFATFLDFLNQLGPAVPIVTGAIIGLVTAIWLINAAMAANPLTLFVLALVAVGVGIAILWNKFETFRNVVMTVFNFIKDNWKLLLVIITGPIGLAVAAIIKNFDALKDAAGVVTDFIGSVFTWLWNNAIQPAVKFIITAFGVLLNTWGVLLTTLGKVPGFGWAKSAGEAMKAAGDKALGLADNINKIPDQKDVLFKSNAKALLNTVNQLNAAVAAGGGKVHYSTGYGGGQTAYATGTNYAQGGPALVGEHGPEMVDLPRGTKVKTAQETNAWMNQDLGPIDLTDDTVARLAAAMLAGASWVASKTVSANNLAIANGVVNG